MENFNSISFGLDGKLSEFIEFNGNKVKGNKVIVNKFNQLKREILNDQWTNLLLIRSMKLILLCLKSKIQLMNYLFKIVEMMPNKNDYLT